MARSSKIILKMPEATVASCLDSVPAWVCSQCGESYFEAAEVDAIQDLIQAIEQKTHAIALAA